MKVLVTNDDGLDSDGIRILASVLAIEHDVWIVAPHSNRSGVSHGISLADTLLLQIESEQVWSCSGLPVDCTILGAQGIMPERPDVVISGINRGANLGTDIVYSGTAAAARQAVINGMPGIAVSMIECKGVYHWEPLARFVCSNLTTLISLCSRDIFININARSSLSWKGAKITGISKRDYRDTIHMHAGPDGSRYGFFQGGDIQTEGDSDSDWAAVQDGCIAVSRVLAQPVSVPVTEGSVPGFIL